MQLNINEDVELSILTLNMKFYKLNCEEIQLSSNDFTFFKKKHFEKHSSDKIRTHSFHIQ